MFRRGPATAAFLRRRMRVRTPVHAAILAMLALAAPARTQVPAYAEACPAASVARRECAPVPTEFHADVAQAVHYARRMRLHDQAAWHATDALMAAGALGNLPGPGRGWLTYEDRGRVVVRYFSEVDFATMAIAEADYDAKTGTVTRARRLDPALPATADDLVLLRARALAISQQPLRCSSSFNTIVLREPEDQGRIRVYVLSAWDGDAFIFGGHSKVMVSADGRTVDSVSPHSRACIRIGDEPMPEGFEPTGDTLVTHINSPTPNEFHVFLSRQHDTTVSVMTVANKHLWRVAGELVTLFPEQAPASEAPP